MTDSTPPNTWFSGPARPVNGGGNTVALRPHTVEVGLQSRAWWWWRCTCTKWGSGYHHESTARKSADEHKHYGVPG